MAISMLKIRRPLGRLIFNMGIAIPGKTVFLIETAPSIAFMVWLSAKYISQTSGSHFLKQIQYTYTIYINIYIYNRCLFFVWNIHIVGCISALFVTDTHSTFVAEILRTGRDNDLFYLLLSWTDCCINSRVVGYLKHRESNGTSL